MADKAPEETLLVEIGSHQAVRIDKLFGPLVAHDLRIWLDVGECEWVVEMEYYLPEVDGEYAGSRWQEMARFDAQPDDARPNG